MIKPIRKIAFPLFILWVLLIFFFYGENFSFSGTWDNFVGDELLGGGIFIFFCFLIGNRFFQFLCLSYSSVMEEVLFSAGLGAGIIYLSIFILGLLQAFYPSTLGSLFVFLLILALSNWKNLERLRDKIKNYQPYFSFIEVVLFSLLSGFILLALFNTLTPPFYRDALIHHLALPKWYLRHYRIEDIPFAIFSYYPPFMEMLYTGALFFRSDILAQLLHYLFYFGCLFLTFILANKFLSRALSLLTVLLFGSLPVVFRIASVAYSDFGLTFFALEGSLALFYWINTKELKWFYLSAVMVGLTVSCKYNGLIIFLFFGATILVIMARWKVPGKSLLKNAFFFLLIVFLINSLWLGKNLRYTGNPIFPLGGKIFNKNPEQPQTLLSSFEIRKLIYGEDLKDQIFLPWNLAVKTKTKSRQELDGVINPIFLVFLPIFFFLPAKPAEIKWIAFFCLFYFLFFWASGEIRLRYLMPIYPFLSFLTIYSVNNWHSKWKKSGGWFIIGLSLVLNLYWVLSYTVTVNPINFLLGKESRTAFLTRHLPSYPVFEYINRHLPPTSRIMFLYGGNFGNDGYYLNRDYVFGAWDLAAPIKDIIQNSSRPEEVYQKLVRMNISHLLINWKLLKMDFSSSLAQEKILLFQHFSQKYLYLEFKKGGSFLYRLK